MLKYKINHYIDLCVQEKKCHIGKWKEAIANELFKI